MAQRGKHRAEKDPRLNRRMTGLITFVSVSALLMALLPGVSLAAPSQQETFRHWLNDKGNWATGAINAQNSSYSEGDVIPHWIEWTNATIGDQISFSFSYEWQDAAGNTGHDYLDDVNETEAAPLVGALSDVVIPIDPEVVGQLGAQPSGQFLFAGFIVDSLSLQSFDHGDREDKYYSLTVTFTDTTAHLYYGAHLAKASQWPSGGASSFSGGNLENRFDRDGIGVGSSADQTRSIQVGAITSEPLAGVDIEKATNGVDADTPTGPQIVAGAPVTWTYVVTNTGNIALTGITVTDNQDVTVTCPATTLAVAASMTCTATGTATVGQYTNQATVTTDQQTTDTDTSHYLGFIPEEPGVDIEKATNGVDADTPTGPQIVAGAPVTWTYVVTNTGNIALTGITVTDNQDVTVTCPATTLAVAASMTCTATGTATVGQYTNQATVTTDQQTTDTDTSHYLGFIPEEPGVDIEKATNGVDADTPTGPQIVAGAPVTWTYVVTNTGNIALTGITVTDNQDVTVTCPATTLAVAASMTCTATGTATVGQYTNQATVTTDQQTTDTDTSHYLGFIPEEPGVDIEKATNGVDADTPTGPQIVAGAPVTWTYVVTNTGNIALTGITVTDNQDVTVTCPATTLAVAASMTCTATGTATVGQYTNQATVTTDQQTTDTDTSHYLGLPLATTTTVEPLGSIGDFVWDDGAINEADGIPESDEPGVSGIDVNLYAGSGTIKLASTVTDTDGKYLFADLPAGSYIVEFVIPAGSGFSFVPGNPAGPDPMDSDADPITGRTGVIVLAAGQNDLSWDAGLAKSAVLPQVITTATSTPTETLPFTGADDGGIGGTGVALLLLGSIVLLVARRREEEPAGV